MKTYRGTPGPPENAVTVEDTSGLRIISPPALGFGWGDGGPPATHLALALASDVLGDRDAAMRVYQRLKHRTVALWQADAPWTITESEIRVQIDEILKVERETAQTRMMVAREPAPVAMEGGRDIVWDSAEPRTRMGR